VGRLFSLENKEKEISTRSEASQQQGAEVAFVVRLYRLLVSWVSAPTWRLRP